ncbi:MAG TPA: hypothetical protein VHR45_01460 [Thermoanaerobaculia bacterium]|nr:hypothetical protein [Thermoanaerobaculia bacterium]
MEHIHLWQVVGLIVLGAYLVYAQSQRTSKGGTRAPAGAKQAAAKAQQTPEEAYLDLRRQAIETDPKRLALAGELQVEEPFGLLMEMGTSNSVVTLACFADGDARVLYKTGGGMIGGISHESVRNAAKELIALAGKALPRLTKTTSYPLPGEDRIRFYVLTRGGVLTIETSRQALGDRRGGELSSMFQSGQEVVAQMRQVGDQKSQDAT